MHLVLRKRAFLWTFCALFYSLMISSPAIASEKCVQSTIVRWISDSVLNAYLRSFRGKTLAQVISLQRENFQQLSLADLEENLNRWSRIEVKNRGHFEGRFLNSEPRGWKSLKALLDSKSAEKEGIFSDIYGGSVYHLHVKLYYYSSPTAVYGTPERAADAKYSADEESSVIDFLLEAQNEMISSLLLHEWCKRRLESEPPERLQRLRGEINDYEEQLAVILEEAEKQL